MARAPSRHKRAWCSPSPFVLDGLKDMVDAISSVFPKHSIKTCLVHVSSNLAHKVRVSDRAKICEDFKAVYRADDREAREQVLKDFYKKWQSPFSPSSISKASSPPIHLLPVSSYGLLKTSPFPHP